MPRETRGARFQKLFRTTAFKLSLAYLAIFALCAFLALGYVAWNARAVLDDQIVSTIDAEINGLSEQYNAGGLRRLITVVERRSREPGASLYLVTTAGGDHVVGNVGYVPAAVLATPGQSETRYGRNDSDAEAHRAIVRVFTLPGGFRLLVGRDTEERDRLRAVIGRAFVTALAAVVILGVIGGWLAASRVLRRVDAMTQTTRAIMAGDLDGRLHVAGNGDELDRLASSLNLMLERIGELMRGMREVSDNIAHDLKTPLTRLRNRADEALRRAASPGGAARGARGRHRGGRRPDPGVQRPPDDRPTGGRQRAGDSGAAGSRPGGSGRRRTCTRRSQRIRASSSTCARRTA